MPFLIKLKHCHCHAVAKIEKRTIRAALSAMREYHDAAVDS